LLKHSRDIAILSGIVYFIQGAMGVTGVALPLYLRSLKWSISEIAAVSSIAAFPWVIKIIYGLLSDSYPLFGYRRKSYLILFSLCSVIGWASLVVMPGEKAWILGAMILANLGFAATDVITDGLIVEHSNEFTSPIYQSIAWGSRSMGSVVSGFTGGWLAQHWDPRNVFMLAMVLPIMTSFIALWILEKRVEHPIFQSPWGTVVATGKLMWTSNIRLFCVILFGVSISAAFGTPYFFYLKESLGFSSTFLGMLASIGWFGAMIGSFIYAKLLRKVSPKVTLRWAIVVNSVNIFSCLLIQNQTTAFVLVFLGGVMGCLVMLPIMSSAAALTHHSGVEGTLFAVLMSIFNLGQISFGLLGAQAYHFIGLFPLIITTGFLALIALFFVEKLQFTAD
jgi:MFS family permease